MGGYATGAAEEKLPVGWDPLRAYWAWGEYTNGDEAARGLVDAEPQFGSSGLMGSPETVWKLMPHITHRLATISTFRAAAVPNIRSS